MPRQKKSPNLTEESLAGDTQPLLGQSDTDSKWWKDERKQRLIILWCTFVAIVGLVILGILAGKSGKKEWKDRSTYGPTLVIAEHGAVATELIDCSEVGVAILKEGGNAVDAAIASTICIGTTNAFSSGIGGGGFMLIRTPNGTYDFIDFREAAPTASNVSMFVKNPRLAQVGGLAVAVPGEIRGLELAHKRHGRLPWRRLFEPSINMSRNGFEVPPELGHRLQLLKAWIETAPNFSNIYAPNGVVLKEGDLLKHENFSRTLEAIADHGADAFYTGPIAESIVSFVRANGGILSMDDMASYKAVLREPIETYYHGRRIVTGGAPSGGPALLAMLNILEGYELKSHRRDLEEALDAHKIVEAMKYGFAWRTELADPEYANNSIRAAEIISKAYAARARANITDDRTHPVAYYEPKFESVENHGTTHLSVVDDDDMAVTLTSTVNLWFGAQIMDPVTGVILNDEMDDFSIPGITNAFGLPPSPLNYVAPRKRPLSSSVPTIIEEDTKFLMALGASGGSRIITATLLAIIETLDKNRDLLQAIHSPRVHHQLMPDIAMVEHGFNPLWESALRDRGHNVTILPTLLALSEVQVVRRLPNGKVEAVSDFRKQGIAAGY